MMYRIRKFFETRREMRETDRAVSQYLRDHYTLWDLISGRWRYIPVQNPYHRKVYSRRYRYTRIPERCSHRIY